MRKQAATHKEIALFLFFFAYFTRSLMRTNERMRMFKNRAIRIELDKKDKGATTQPTTTFEEKAGIIFHKLESMGVKVFVGVCVYVLLDTYRKCEVEKNKQQ